MTEHHNKWWTHSRVTGTYLVSVMLVLLFIAFQAFTVPMPTRMPDEQKILGGEIPEATPGPPPTATSVKRGQALALMEIPRFGQNWLWTTLEGVRMEIVNKGPGHYPRTVLPGEEGNSAFAAHRATHGDPFLNFEELELGDKIYLSQKGARWTYEVRTEPEVIETDELWVLDDFAPGKWLTLTTCWPKYGSEKRMYIRAELVNTEN